MSRPWMPLYVGDYLRDTRRLGAAEHGAYLLLMMEYWTVGNLPNDDEQLARIACMSLAEWRKARPIIQPFFRDGWRHTRIEAELTKVEEVSQRYATRARKAANARHHKDASSNATSMLPGLLADIDKQSLEESNSQPQSQPQDSFRSARADEGDFPIFWSIYPKRDGDNPRKAALKSWRTAIKNGADPETIIGATRTFADDMQTKGKIGTPYVPMAATWLNQERWKEIQLQSATTIGFSGYTLTKDSPSVDAWREYLQRAGRNFSIRKMEEFFAKGEPYPVPSEWPPDDQSNKQAA